MKMITKIIVMIFSLLIAVVAFADDKFVESIKKMPLANGSMPVSTQFEKAFDNQSWTYSDVKGTKAVTFNGTVKKGSIFPDSEKDTYFDMQYSTIEESQMTGNVEVLFTKYIKIESKELQQRSGYFDKKLLSSEKNYNILEILEEKAIGSPVKAVLALSKDGKTVELISFDAPKLYIHNDSSASFIRFVNSAR